MNQITIYCLIDPIDNLPKYIGATKNVKRRYHLHTCSASFNRETNNKAAWIRALSEVGEKPKLDILDVVDFSESDFWEKHYISLYKSWGFELKNTTVEGSEIWNKGKTGVYTEKMIERMSRNTAEYIKKNGHPFQGKNHTPEAIAKIRQFNLGRKASEETKKKMSKILTEGLYFDKPILQYDLNGNFIKEWEGFSKAKRALKLNHIWDCCNGKRKKCGGFIWKYKKPNTQ